MLAVPLGLIFLQPDLGTMLVFVAIGMGVLLVAGAQIKHIVVTSLIGIVVVVGMFNSDNLGGPELLRETQENRLTAFLDPTFDMQGASYNVNQSQIAIGAGGPMRSRLAPRELKPTSTSYPNRKPTSYSQHWEKSSGL